MTAQSSTINPIADAKAALNAAANRTQAQLDAKAQKEAADRAAREQAEAEANKPENVRARQRAHIKEEADHLLASLAVASQKIKEKVQEIERTVTDPRKK